MITLFFWKHLFPHLFPKEMSQLKNVPEVNSAGLIWHFLVSIGRRRGCHLLLQFLPNAEDDALLSRR